MRRPLSSPLLSSWGSLLHDQRCPHALVVQLRFVCRMTQYLSSAESLPAPHVITLLAELNTSQNAILHAMIITTRDLSTLTA